MSDLDYFKGQWGEFRKWEEKEHDHIRQDLRDIKKSVAYLNIRIVAISTTLVLIGGFVKAILG